MSLSDYNSKNFWSWAKSEILLALKDVKFLIIHLLGAFSIVSLIWQFEAPILRVVLDAYKFSVEFFWSLVSQLISVEIGERLSALLSFILIFGIIRIRSAWLRLPSLPKKDQVFGLFLALSAVYGAVLALVDPDLMNLGFDAPILNAAIIFLACPLGVLYIVLSERFVWINQSILPAGELRAYYKDSILVAGLSMASFVCFSIVGVWTGDRFFWSGDSHLPIYLSSIAVIVSGIFFLAGSLAYVRSTAATAILSIGLMLSDALMTRLGI